MIQSVAKGEAGSQDVVSNASRYGKSNAQITSYNRIVSDGMKIGISVNFHVVSFFHIHCC
jgi:hypothetical protein